MKKHAKMFLSIMMSLVLLLQCNFSSFVTVNALELPNDSETIDEDIYENADTKDDKYLVCLWRHSIPEDDINEAVREQTGFDPLVYENDELYEGIIAEEITQMVISEYGEKAYLPSEEMQKRDEGFSRIDEALSKNYDEYILAKREVIAMLYAEFNNAFIDEYVKYPSEIIYKGMYTSTIILYATKDEIETYAASDEVTQISPYVDEEQTPSLFAVQSQIGTDADTGTRSTSYNGGSGYRGTNVKVGILEAGAGRYRASATQLASIPSTQLQYVANERSDGTTVTPTVTDHATMVTTLIVGQSVTVNGRLYEGVVPNATVYQMPIVYGSDVMNGISQLAALGVTVINYSGGSGNTLEYASYDREVDNILKSTGVTFVVSAGNTGNNDPTENEDDPQYPCITSPAKAYNAITVGNLRTKSGTYTKLSPTYSMSSSSSYDEATGMTAKPDVSAPGSSIAYVSSGTTVTSMSGTSCAAPLVTGLVAQLHQYRYTLRSNQTRTKAMVIIGASNDNISTTNNATAGSTQIRDRSGAGLVSATASMDIAKQYTEAVYSINLYTISSNPTYQKTISLEEGQTIRVVLVFDKCEDGTIPSVGYVNDVDVRLYTESGSLKKSSVSNYNNVEIFEYTATEAGSFYIQVKLHDYIAATENTYLKIALVWDIE